MYAKFRIRNSLILKPRLHPYEIVFFSVIKHISRKAGILERNSLKNQITALPNSLTFQQSDFVLW